MNIPFGGAKGGICCEPKNLSQRELERLTRKLVQVGGCLPNAKTTLHAALKQTNNQSAIKQARKQARSPPTNQPSSQARKQSPKPETDAATNRSIREPIKQAGAFLVLRLLPGQQAQAQGCSPDRWRVSPCMHDQALLADHAEMPGWDLVQLICCPFQVTLCSKSTQYHRLKCSQVHFRVGACDTYCRPDFLEDLLCHCCCIRIL